jgi:hypothetical protein
MKAWVGIGRLVSAQVVVTRNFRPNPNITLIPAPSEVGALPKSDGDDTISNAQAGEEFTASVAPRRGAKRMDAADA